MFIEQSQKYLQLGNSIVEAIKNGKLKRDDILPFPIIRQVSSNLVQQNYLQVKNDV